jgi:hypothetical protein
MAAATHTEIKAESFHRDVMTGFARVDNDLSGTKALAVRNDFFC